ncbi:NAD(P)-dependent alcohol dehydrogenase [Microbacterium sp. YY-01]|uniref:NAD(P)-dependent alcohol dehydrogenase n=1 Tax=Microbacterium sp. YY-01 TaxID=3421634 RepID=UPI003D173C20
MTTHLPSTMQVSVLHKARDLRNEERAVPTPAPREVLVRVRAVGVCGSDTHYYTDGRIGDFTVDQPLILGHEASGEIVAVGDGVDPARIGERVSMEPGIPTAFSHETLTGNYNLDPSVQFFATPPVDGTFAEYVTHPAAFTYAVPDTVSLTAAAMLEPLSVAIAATQSAHIGLGSHVLIAGAGPIGLLTAAVARLRGATRVHVFDVREERLSTAEQYGAHRAMLANEVNTAHDRYHAFIDATGATPAITTGIACLGPRGTAVLVGMGADTVPLPLSLIQGREISVTGTFRYRNTWPTAVELASAQAIDLDGLITSRFPLAQAEEALLAGAQPGQIKALVEP